MTILREVSKDHIPAIQPADDGNQSRELLDAIFQYKLLILLVTCMGTAAALVWTLQRTEIYEAKTQLEYALESQRPLGDEVADVTNTVSNYLATRDFIETQNRIIGSHTIAKRVVSQLGLQHDASFMGIEPEEAETWEGVSVDAAAEELRERLRVESVQETRLAFIQVKDSDPERAATLANTIADAYLAREEENHQASTVGAVEWLGNRLETLRSDLAASERRLHDFRQNDDALAPSLETRQEMVSSELQRLTAELGEVRSRRIALTATMQELNRAFSEELPPTSLRPPSSTERDALDQLRRDYREKLVERQALSSRYGDSHPEMLAINGQIERVANQIRDEAAGLIQETRLSLNEARQTEAGLMQQLETATEEGLELKEKEIAHARLSQERDTNATLYDFVLKRTTETNLTRMFHSTPARIVDRALVPDEVVSPRVKLNVAFGFIASLMLGCLLAVVLAKMDRSVRSIEDVEKIGVSILGSIPMVRNKGWTMIGSKPKPKAANERGITSMMAHSDPMSPAAESFRVIRTNLVFASPDTPFRSLVITSGSPSDGKTTAVTNLAISIAQSGKRVLLVDTDLRRPQLHRVFNIKPTTGVTSVLVGQATLSECARPTDVANLEVLPSGPIPPNPSELLHSTRFQELHRKALAKYDFVLFDSPPLQAVTDAAILAAQVSGTITVIRAEKTTRDGLQKTLKHLESVGANVMGVFNAVEPKGPRSYAYYRYQQRYGQYRSGESADDDPKEASA